jgi:hypothetical protein
MEPAPTTPRHEAIDRDDLLVHEWRVMQLTRLGIPWSLAPARHEAAAAITICASCPVRAQRLDLSLRHWDTVQHGVWSGPVATDRARPRRPSRAAAMTRCPRAGWTRPAPWRTWPGFWPPPMKDGAPVFYRFAVPGER